MTTNAIEIAGLTKRYTLGESANFSTTLSEALATWRRRRQRATPGEVWALRDVTLDVPEGQVLGIIGRNGAGKSTLLKILARITDPTAGRARIRGRVGALLEVGTAFHSELTGRENIEINAAMLGMSRPDLRRRFDEIVDFAGVGPFLDTPVKRYSSGMYLRLAFAVAAHVEPDVVVVDEVLAVGDAEFQRRCLGKMSELGSEGRTVLFVSHDLGAIGRLADRTVWLDQGRVRADGPTAEVVRRYLSDALPTGTAVALDLSASAAAAPVRVELLNRDRDAVKGLTRGDPFTIRTTIETRTPFQRLEVAVWVVTDDGVRVLDEALNDTAELAGALDAPGMYRVDLELPPLLPAGHYALGVWLGDFRDVIFDEEVLRFTVAARLDDPDEMARRRRVASPSVRWSVARQ